MPALQNQPQIQSKNFVAQYRHDGLLLLDVFGQFNDAGGFSLEAIGVAGTTIDISNAISDDLSNVIIGWAEFMAPTWKAESIAQHRIDEYLWAREMAVAF